MKQLFDLVRQAGNIALEEQKKLQIEKKADNSAVTNGDLAVSAFLERELKKLYPDYEIFSEENTKTIPQGKKVIILDPIDGTESYLRKEASWSVLIGFLDDMEPVGGVVYQPTNNRLYWAFKSQGAFLEVDGITSQLSAQGKSGLKAVASPKDYEEKTWLASKGIHDALLFYSAALKIMEVAKGEADIYPNFRKKCSLWDLVAPSIILSESGGKMIYESPSSANFKNPHVDSKFCALGKRCLDISF